MIRIDVRWMNVSSGTGSPTINCLHQTGLTGRKMERLGMSLTCSTITMSVAVSVTLSKMGVILHQTWSEN